MQILGLTTDKIQVISSSTSALDVTGSFMDMSTADPPVVKGSTSGPLAVAITTAATTDVLAAPAASTLRNLTELLIRNKGAADNTVTVQLNRNAVLYERHKVTLKAGEALEYVEGSGFVVLAAAGRLNAIRRVTADSVHATAATFADVTGLTCPVESGKHYVFEAHLIHVGNATTTGAQFGIGGVAMTAMRISMIDTILGSATAATMGTPVADVTAVNTAAIVETTGAATTVLGILSGWFQPSASGTFAIRATSEVSVAAGLTVKQGSWARIMESDN